MSLPSFCVDPDFVLKDKTGLIKWRNGIPNYNKVQILYENHKTTNHEKGSLASIVENIVKNWEKEVSHITDPSQWSTVDLNHYRFSVNGQQKYTAGQMLKQGTYNALIGQTNYYDSNAISFEDSHSAFKRSLGEGFAWELLEVYSGPPTVTFSWRHFGKMTDYFSCPGLSGLVYKVDPTNKMIKVFGMCKATVNESFQIQDLQIFYDPSQLFTQLTEISPFAPFIKLPNNRSIQSTNQEQINHHSIPGEKKRISNKYVQKDQFQVNQQSKLCLIM